MKMLKTYQKIKGLMAFVLVFLATSVVAQIKYTQADLVGFDEKQVQAEMDAMLKNGVPASELETFMESRKMEYVFKKYAANTKKSFPVNQTQKTFAAGCTNSDFESGSFNGWSAATGCAPKAYNYANSYAGMCSGDQNYCCSTSGFVAGQQTIMTGNGTDAYGGFPVVAPGGSYSALLGNTAVAGHSEELSYSFTVDANSTSFTYQYAVVLQDPGHTTANQPFFQIDMYDASGNLIPCSHYFVAAGQGIPGFQNSTTNGIIYKPWSKVIVDLTPYVGQNVSIRFYTADCAQGGHWGYAYIDGSCAPFAITQSVQFCTNSTTTLSAPAGAASYTWSGPNGYSSSSTTSNSITVSEAGNYSVTMVSVQGCTTVLNYTLTSVSSTAGFSPTQTCVGGPINFSDLSVAYNGTTITNWNWDFGDGVTSTLQNPTHTFPVAGGPYTTTLTVTSSNGCTSSFSSPINFYSPPTITGTTIDPTCFGGANGSITATPAGSNPYTYSWNNGSTSETLSSVSAGTYTVTVTDVHTCSSTKSFTLTQPTILNTNTTSTAADCNSGTTGTVNAVASGGTGAYSYSWSTNNTTATVTGLGAGNYTVLVTDANNCTTTATAIVTEPTALTINTNVVDVTCYNGSNATISVSTSGGTNPYTYSWNFSVAQTSATASNLSAGGYTITSTDAHGCSRSTVVNVQEPTALINFITSTGSVSCFGGNDGNATTYATGGTPPYTYSWNTNPTQADTTVINLSAGTYTVVIQDANGCTVTNAATVTQPQPLSLTASSPTSVSCFSGSNGIANVTPSGGTSPYSYTWSNGQSNASAISLSAANYTVNVSDAKGCSTTTTVDVTEPTKLFSSVPSYTNNICFKGHSGIASGSAIGGVAPYTYLWNTGAQVQTISDLEAGTYTVIISDANGCTSSSTATITEPTEILVSFCATCTQNVSCKNGSNGSAKALATEGVPSYSYSWSNGQTTQSATGLAAGTYTVKVTDSNGCIKANNIAITEPSALTTTVQGGYTKCYGSSDGSATILATGSNSPYNYSWNTGETSNKLTASMGSYSVTITDALGCSASTVVTISEPSPLVASINAKTNVRCYSLNNGTATVSAIGGTTPYTYSWSTNSKTQTGPTATGLTAGDYNVLVSDANQCTTSQTATITEPAPLTATLNNSTLASCFGGNDGTATIQVDGGSSPYTFLWTTNNQTTSNASGLTAGTHTVNITDKNGCNMQYTASIGQPSPINLSISGTTEVCAGKKATINVSSNGGNGGLTYSWSVPGATSNSITVYPTTTTSYTVTATDSKGCTTPPSVFTVNVPKMNGVNINIVGAKDICEGSSLELKAELTNTPATYGVQWNNNLGTGLGPFTVVPTGPTVYIVTVTDMCNNTSTKSALVNIIKKPVIVLPPRVATGCDGIELPFIDTSAANAGSKYLWNFGDGSTSTEANPNHNYTSSGTFNVSVSITSSVGCVGNASTTYVTIVNPSPVASFDVESKASIAQPTFKLVNTSINNLTNLWYFGDGNTSEELNPTHTYKTKGKYTISLVTHNQSVCVDSVAKEVEIYPEFEFYVPNAFTPDGDGKNDVFNGKGEEITSYHMMIFDRWGDMIFETYDLNKGWTGYANGGKEIAQQDTYVYKIKLTDFTGEVHDYIGHVSLLK